MFANQFFYVLPVKLTNAFDYEKFITDNKGILVSEPRHCIVITSLVSEKRLLKHVDSSCKCISNEYLDELRKNNSIKMDKFIVYEKQVLFDDDRIVYHPFPMVQGEKKQIVEMLQIVAKERELNGEHFNAIAYKNAISGLTATSKSVKECIDTNFKDVAYIGPKISTVINEFMTTGDIQEVNNIQKSERYMAINKLTDIWGVGERTALEWYNKGYRSIEDVMDGNEKLNKTVQLGIKYRHDLNKKISRPLVNNIVDRLDEICEWKANNISVDIVGGYRRLKKESGDIDIVLCHDNDDVCESILDKSLASLKGAEMLTDVYQKSTRLKHRFDTGNKRNESDDLDKALTIINYEGIHRQVDLIVCTREQYPFCILGWTGSASYERLIKTHAKRLGFTLSSSAIYDITTKEKYPCSSEAHIFQFLGLPFQEPHLRNA